ncbi:hypothetical protein Tcan_18307 [Toxocara canis]|uniref:Uncharacterized protein n=1 Tax=Toxocara canis TaxID=6265 RepID=A0A0B2W0C9_TOXCA|nr:hypothetical protein Tcan_18307 [Toxocara canis]
MEVQVRRMLIYSLIALLPLAIADSLVLYYPVYPGLPVPESKQDFEKNAPPRVWPRDPDAPATGIVYIRRSNKLLQKPPEIDWKEHLISEREFDDEDERVVQQRKIFAKIEPTTRSPQRPTPEVVVPSTIGLQRKRFEFVDVVDGDADFSAFDNNDNNEDSNKIYDDDFVSPSHERVKNNRRVHEVDGDTERIVSNSKINAQRSHPSMVPFTKNSEVRGAQTVWRQNRALGSTIHAGEVMRTNEEPTIGLQQRVRGVRFLNAASALRSRII